MISSTRAYKLVSDYVYSEVKLKEDKFGKFFTDDVAFKHASSAHPFRSNPTDKVIDSEITGKENVFKLFKENFFDVTRNFKIKKISIEIHTEENERYAILFATIVEDKAENETMEPVTYEIKDKSIFKFKKEGGHHKFSSLEMCVGKKKVESI